MNTLIKQFFTPNSPLAQLSDHKTSEGPTGPMGEGLNPGSFVKKIVFVFTK